jgi:molybdopterin adenylyltransferase
MIKAGVLTLSDKGSRGERVDESGKAIKEILAALGANVLKYEVVPDEKDIISARLVEWADKDRLDLILTTGGTGLTPRDVTPEATLAVIDKEVPGFAEAMRAESFKKTPMAVLSRAVSGIRGRTLIINMPGSTRAVRECLEVISPALNHAVETLRGESGDCADKVKKK